MKKAKARYDALTDLLGDASPSFGEMEEVFAGAFLRRFLKTIFDPAYNQQIQQRYRQQLDEEYVEDHLRYNEELPSLSAKQALQVKLDDLRNVIGVLGVKPSLQDLDALVEQAQQSRDFESLSHVLSLVEDDVANDFLVEKGLEAIAEGDRDAEEFKKHFPHVQYDADLVQRYYMQTVQDLPWLNNAEVLARVAEVTGVPIAQELIKQAYVGEIASIAQKSTVRYVDDTVGGLLDYKRLFDLEMPNTQEAAKAIATLFRSDATLVQKEEFLDLLNYESLKVAALDGLCTAQIDEDKYQPYQAIASGINALKRRWDLKPTDEVLDEVLKRWPEDDAIALAANMEIAPEHLHDGMVRFLTQRKSVDLMDRLGLCPPKESLVHRHNLQAVSRLITLYAKHHPDDIEEIVESYLATAEDLARNHEQASFIYERLELPDLCQRTRLRGLVNDIGDALGDFTRRRPGIDNARRTLTDYRKSRRGARDPIKRLLQETKGKVFDEVMQRDLHTVYKHALAVAMIDAEFGLKSLLPVKKVIERTGIPPSPRDCAYAVEHYVTSLIRRGTRGHGLRRKSVPFEGIVERMREEVGVDLLITDDVYRGVAENVVNSMSRSSGNQYHAAVDGTRNLQRLCRMVGKELPEEIIDRLRKFKAIRPHYSAYTPQAREREYQATRLAEEHVQNFVEGLCQD